MADFWAEYAIVTATLCCPGGRPVYVSRISRRDDGDYEGRRRERSRLIPTGLK